MRAEWLPVRDHLQEATKHAAVGATLPDLRAAGRAKRWLGRAYARLANAASRVITSRQRQFNVSLLSAVESLTRQVQALEARLDRADAELRELRSTHEPFHVRPGTLDANIWNVVANENEYRLPGRFAADDLIIDIGCHVGGFSVSCLLRGAGRVEAFEPEPANFAAAATNLARFGPRARLHNRAVWRSDRPGDRLTFRPSNDPENTGGGALMSGEGHEVPWVAFDSLIDRLRAEGFPRVRLLKVDCEGSEFPVLLTSRRLEFVDEICGEYHEFADIPDHSRVDAADRFDRRALVRHLEAAGFTVELEAGPPEEPLGLFFARK